MAINWRDLADTDLTRFRLLLRGSPLEPECDAIYAIARGYTRLIASQGWIESRLGQSPLGREKKNFLGLRPKGGGDGFVTFDSYADCARYWLDKITDPLYAYAKTTTLAEYVHVYAPSWDGNDEAEYLALLTTHLNTIPKGEYTMSQIPANVSVQLINRGTKPLSVNKAWLTLHNTGNTVDANAEHDFFEGGGGAQGVLVHLLTDEARIIQITEFWKQGIHAGNVQGNKTSIAMEMCARRGVFNEIEHNGAKAMAMLYTRDPRLNWSGAEHIEFAPDRTTDHRGWPGANQACPAVLIDRHGSNDVGFMVDLAKTYMKGVTPAPVPKPMPHLVGHEVTKDGTTYQDPNGNWWIWVYRMETPKKPVQLYEWANVDASRKGPLLPAGKGVRTYWNVAVNDPDGTPDIWFTTRLGWRGRLADLRAA
jgi:N-acetylmuramoyl-L-alanine amidase CwlA